MEGRWHSKSSSCWGRWSNPGQTPAAACRQRTCFDLWYHLALSSSIATVPAVSKAVDAGPRTSTQQCTAATGLRADLEFEMRQLLQPDAARIPHLRCNATTTLSPPNLLRHEPDPDLS